MANFGILAKLGVDTSNMKKGMKDAGDDADRFGKKLGSAVKAGAMIAGAAIAAMAAKGIKDFMDFEKKISEVFTLMPDMSASAQAAMANDMRELAKVMGVDLIDATNGLYQAISAGVSPDNAITFLETASKAAIAGVADLETSVGALTTIMNGYGMEASEAERISDVLFSVVKIGVTNFTELGANIGKVTPLAAELGISIEEVGAMFATLTKTLGAGKTAEAGTQIRSMLAELAKGGMKAFENFKEAAGVTFPAFIKQGGSVKDALVLMTEHAKKSGKQLMDMFRGVEAGMGALTLAAEGGERLGNAIKLIESDVGSMLKAFGTMEKTSAHQFNIMKSNFVDAGIAMGAALMPVVNMILPALTSAFQVMAGAVKNTMKFLGNSPAIVKILGAAFRALGVAMGTFAVLAVGLGVKMAAVAVAMRVAAVASALFGTSVKVASVAMKTSGIGAVISLVVGLGVAFTEWKSAATDAAEASRKAGEEELKGLRKLEASADATIKRIREVRDERRKQQEINNKEKEIRAKPGGLSELEIERELASFRRKTTKNEIRQKEARIRIEKESFKIQKEHNTKLKAQLLDGETISLRLEKKLLREKQTYADLMKANEDLFALKEKQANETQTILGLEEKIVKEIERRVNSEKEARDIILQAREEWQLTQTEMGKAMGIAKQIAVLERERFEIVAKQRAGLRGEEESQEALFQNTMKKLQLEKDLDVILKNKRDTLLKEEVKLHQEAVNVLDKKLAKQLKIRDAAKAVADEAERELAVQKKIAQEGLDKLKGLEDKFGGKVGLRGERVGRGEFKLSSSKMRKEFRELKAKGELPEGVENMQDFQKHLEKQIRDGQNQVADARGKGGKLVKQAQEERDKQKEAAEEIKRIEDAIAKEKKSIIELEEKLLDKTKRSREEITKERIALEKALADVRQHLQGAKIVAPDILKSVKDILEVVGIRAKEMENQVGRNVKTPLSGGFDSSVTITADGRVFDALTGELIGMKDGQADNIEELQNANITLSDIRKSIEDFTIVNQ